MNNKTGEIVIWARGHENIRASHHSTLEITTDSEVSPRGDCIVGVDASPLDAFRRLRKLAHENPSKNICILIECMGCRGMNDKSVCSDRVCGRLNQDFSSEREIVIRLSSFSSERTLVINADKSAFMLNPLLRKGLSSGCRIKVTFKTGD